MKDMNRYLKYINFTPYKLKVFKTENFSISTPELIKHKASFSSFTKNRINNPVLIRNPTQNYLFDKININNLSTSKLLLDKSIKNENSIFNTLNRNCNKNSKSSDNTLTRYYKIKKSNRNRYNQYNFRESKNNNYFNIHKNKTPDKTYNYEGFNKGIKNEYNLSNYNSNNVVMSINKNNIYDNDYLIKPEKEKFENKIVLIQSFWRSYFLRKLVVGGLEKYYSSIAMSKYLNNIFIKNKKIFFKEFIESLKLYILHERYSCFKYKKNRNKINIFFKGNKNSEESFEIPNDKRNDCIYYFIKREQIKSKKLKVMNNKYLIDKNKNINIKDYNWKYDKKGKNNKDKMISIYNKNNKERFNKNNINIKINLINQNNIEMNKKNNSKNYKGISSDYIINNKEKFIHKYKRNINSNKNIKLIKENRHKNIYSKKKNRRRK